MDALKVLKRDFDTAFGILVETQLADRLKYYLTISPNQRMILATIFSGHAHLLTSQGLSENIKVEEVEAILADSLEGIRGVRDRIGREYVSASLDRISRFYQKNSSKAVLAASLPPNMLELLERWKGIVQECKADLLGIIAECLDPKGRKFEVSEETEEILQRVGLEIERLRRVQNHLKAATQ